MKNHASFALKNNYTITLISLHSLPYIGFYMAIFISHVSPMSLYISLRAVRLHSATESNKNKMSYHDFYIIYL